jgi:hypothetical protein
VYAIAAQPIGNPGCPEFAFCTPSADRKRMVLMASFSISVEISILIPHHEDAVFYHAGQFTAFSMPAAFIIKSVKRRNY